MKEMNEIHKRIDDLVVESFEHFGINVDEHVLNKAKF
jgi:hypothetical protein